MNSFGRNLKFTLYGASHGKSLGIIIDGVPPGINIKEEDFTDDILRRKSGAKGTTPRIEKDQVNIESGVYNDFSSGAPILLTFENSNTRSEDYSRLKKTPRPGHADYISSIKYKGFNDPNGGGQFSGRMTLPIVAAGVIAKKILKESKFKAELIEVGASKDIESTIDNVLKNGDSVGGIVECRVDNLPQALGEPFFDSVESLISHLMFSIPAVKGIEFGSGFQASKMKGSEHNDVYLDEKGTTKTNNSGGINGGLTNGNQLVFRVAVKPTSSISKEQETYNSESGEIDKLSVKGRHDACIALRFPVILESVAALVLADLFLTNRA